MLHMISFLSMIFLILCLGSSLQAQVPITPKTLGDCEYFQGEQRIECFEKYHELRRRLEEHRREERRREEERCRDLGYEHCKEKEDS